MKKVKLFTTIASLCLAVALMAFGVYAASNSFKHTVSGNITYESTSLKGKWTVTVTPDANCTVTGAPTSDITAANNLVEEVDQGTTSSDIEVAIKPNKDGATFTVKVVFTAESTTPGTLSVAHTNDVQTAYSVTYETLTSDADHDTEISTTAGDTATITVKVTIDILDTTTSFTGENAIDWSMAFTAQAGTLS